MNTLLGFGIDATHRRRDSARAAAASPGPPLKPVALRAVHDVARAFPGVPDHRHRRREHRGEDVVEMLLAGATAVGVGTVTFREPRAMLRILDELETWCGEHGVARVADLTARTGGEWTDDRTPEVSGERSVTAWCWAWTSAGWPRPRRSGAAGAVVRRRQGRPRALRRGRPAAFDRMHELGFRVFCDLKLHDIPNTVERAARAHARHGVEFMNAHAAEAKRCCARSSPAPVTVPRDVRSPPPVTLAVTVLTSEPDASAFDERLRLRAARV